MTLLVRTGKLPREEKWLKSIARFLCVHGFFHVVEGAVGEEEGEELAVGVVMRF